LMHAFIFWGFLVLTVGSINIIIKGLIPGPDRGWGIPIIDGNPVFTLLTDFFLVTVGIAVLIAFYRRFVTRPQRLTLSSEALLILSLIMTLVVTEVLAEGFLAAWEGETSVWEPIGAVLAPAFSGLGQDGNWVGFSVMWWAHIVTLLFFLTYLPRSKHLHIMTAPFNVFLRNLGNRGALSKLDIENSETFGASTLHDYSWKHLLDLYTCTECGRCQDNCPAFLSGKPLSPKELIQDLKHYLMEDGPAILAASANGKEGEGQAQEGESPAGVREMIRGMIEEETIWSCTTCRHCMEACPVFIEHIDKIVDMRRNLVLMEGSMAPEVSTAMKSVESAGNPLQLPTSERANWAQPLGVKTLAEDPDVEYLFFVGCVSSYDQRNVEIAVATAKILQAAGIKFGILGAEEKCCGDPVRRIGNEYLYQMLAMENIEVLNGYNVKKIVTACPHCFNTLKNEYPQFDGNYEVIHHTQLIQELVQSGRLKLRNRLDKTIAFHDSCYLGRYNDIYDQPREVLKAIPGVKLVEMKRSKAFSFCCGGGGGHTWMEEHTGERINQMRVDQAMEVNPDILGSACPFCMMMFDDGIKAKGYEERLQAFDLAELVVQALEGSGKQPAERTTSVPTA
ncbi:MAG: (Fe-S)-binding protein, partial [Chloroflexota bacterium]